MGKRIQYIAYQLKRETIEDVTISRIEAPESLDAFDLNIIDLNDRLIWCCSKPAGDTVNCIQDIYNINRMIEHSKHTNYLILLPAGLTYHYHSSGDYYKYACPLKNRLMVLYTMVNEVLLPDSVNIPEVIYENTKTEIENTEISASYYFDVMEGIITKSIRSDKVTTYRIADRYTVSSLLFNTVAQAVDFAEKYLLSKGKEPIPEWVKGIHFGTDCQQQEIIKENKRRIDSCNLQIAVAQEKLKQNDRFKSILYSSGAELVNVVFDILQRILSCDLSEFIDEKREDFRIKKNEVTFIGEIKGISTNVKSENISQVDRHCQAYSDYLQERGQIERLKQLLIINPLRHQSLEQREPIHETQLKIALRNDCLIIKAEVLLRIFEAFQSGTINTQQIENCFANNSGELTLNMILHS